MREQKKKNWNIKRRSAKQNSSLKYHFRSPRARNNKGKDKREPHFVELKQLKIPRGENKRNEKKEKIERIFNNFVTEIYKPHSYLFYPTILVNGGARGEEKVHQSTPGKSTPGR